MSDQSDQMIEVYAKAIKEECNKRVDALFRTPFAGNTGPMRFTYDEAAPEGERTVYSRFAYGYSTHTEIVPVASAATVTLVPGKDFTKE